MFYICAKYINKASMKKILTLITVLAFSFTIASAATDSENASSNSTGGLNDFKDFTHWSLSINGGLSQFDGDVTQKYNDIFSQSTVSWTVGLDIEYTWNPYWGLIAQFQYMPFLGATKTTEYGSNTFTGNMYDPTLMASLNLLNLFGQYRKTWKWGFYLNAGLGLTFYDMQTTPIPGAPIGTVEQAAITRATNEGKTPAEIAAAAAAAGPQDITDGMSICFPVGLNVEYNFNKYLALGLNAHYRFHNKDYFEGEAYTKGTMNDGEFTATLNFRVKFAPNKKEGGHMRNISPYAYRELKTGDKNFQDQLDSLKRRVAAVEDTLSNNVLPRIAALEAQQATRPDGDGDGVPDFRDREPNTPQGSFVNYWGESIPQEIMQSAKCCDEVKSVLAAMGAGIDYEMSVYFPFDKYYLTNVAKSNVAKAAQKLKEDPELQVELRGYCDFPGSGDYNMKLSSNRVETVKKELIEKYGIDASRISVTPKGKMQNPPMKEYKNRRCDFYFHK